MKQEPAVCPYQRHTVSQERGRGGGWGGVRVEERSGQDADRVKRR